MNGKLHTHLAIAAKAAVFAFKRSSKNGESLEEILGYTDALTGIKNRKAFDEDRKHISAFLTFILIDVDNLKQLNDTFGHLFGDRILRDCAHILAKATDKVGNVYRLAGDEFAILVPQCWVKTVCLYIKNRIKEDSRFSISMGIAPSCGTDGLTDNVFKSAETALYQCKHREPDIYAEFLVDEIEGIHAPSELHIFEESDCDAESMSVLTT